MCYGSSFDVLHPYLHCWVSFPHDFCFPKLNGRTAAGPAVQGQVVTRETFAGSGSCPELIVINGLDL